MDDRHPERPLRVPVLDRYNDRGTMVLGKVEQVRDDTATRSLAIPRCHAKNERHTSSKEICMAINRQGGAGERRHGQKVACLAPTPPCDERATCHQLERDLFIALNMNMNVKSA